MLLGQWRVGQPIVVKQCDFHMMEAMGDGNSQNDPSTEDPLLSLPPLLSPIIMAWLSISAGRSCRRFVQH